MKYGLSEKQLNEIIDIIDSFPKIEKAYIFGSRAIDTYKEASDVDIAIIGSELKALDAMDVKEQLEEETYLPFFFDVITYGTIKSDELIKHINTKGKLIFCRGREAWEKVKLGDFFQVKHGFAFKGKYITTEKNLDILVTPGNFHIGGGFKTDKFKYFTREYPEDYILHENDIVITMTDLSKETDTLGYSAKIPCSKNGEKYLHNQRIGLVEFKNDNADADYLYWLMRTRDYHGYIVGSASGTSIMHTSPSRIEDYKFYIPTLSEQKAIAEVLTSLDDKIDLLNHQNKTLEAMAETLFRKWFIEEAKEKKTLGECIKTTSGGTPSRKTNSYYENGIYRWVKSKELNRSYILDTEEKITAEGLSKSSAKILPKNSVLIAMYGATVGQFAILGEQATCNQAICACISNEEYPYTFIYFTIKCNEEELKNRAVGSAQQNISQVLIKNLEISINRDKMDIFHKKIDYVMKKIINNTKQIQTLENLRDTLLPKLMSGEIRVDIKNRRVM